MHFYCYWLIVLSFVLLWLHKAKIEPSVVSLWKTQAVPGHDSWIQDMRRALSFFSVDFEEPQASHEVLWKLLLVNLAFSCLIRVGKLLSNSHWFRVESTLISDIVSTLSRQSRQTFWLFSKCSMHVCFISLNFIHCWYIFLYHVKVTIKSHTFQVSFQFNLHKFQKAAKAKYLSEIITKNSHCSRQTFTEIPPLLCENFLRKSTL